MGENSAALAAFQTAIQLRPLRGLYLQQAGMQAAKLGDQKLADQLLSAGLQVQPGRFLPYEEYGLWLLERQRTEEAFAMLRQGLQMQPAQTGRVLTQLALARIEPLLMSQVIPERAQSWQIFAEYLTALQEESVAESAYRHAIILNAGEKHPVTKPFWSFYHYLQKRERYPEALALMLDGIKAFPKNAGFHRNAGSLYERQGIIYRAIEEYQQALLLQPQHKWVRQRLEKLQGK